jgi:hypothetical protein
MDKDFILSKLGQNIFNYFIENTNPGEPFLLLIDPMEYQNIKENTGNIKDVDHALKLTGYLSNVPNDYISIAVANLQVQLIYDIDVRNIDDSFYSVMKNYYSNLVEDHNVYLYFRGFQENLWANVALVFSRKNRCLEIPPKKEGSGRYVQFPKSQRLITYNELIGYADNFLRISLEPHQIISFYDFCKKLYLPFNYSFTNEQNEIIKKIIFAFYNKWNGSSTNEIRKQKQRSKSPLLFSKNRIDVTENKLELTIRFENERMVYRFGKNTITEQELKNHFKNKSVLSFLYDDEYEDWLYTIRPLHSRNRLLVLVDKLARRNTDKYKLLFSTEYYTVYHFDCCDNNVASFTGLSFVTKEYFTIIGGIRIVNWYHFRNDVLGAWYDFALPKIRVDLGIDTQVFIDSKEIIIVDGCIDLDNLVLKENNKNWKLEPRDKEYALKCSDLSPVYFSIKAPKSCSDIDLNRGWKISLDSLRPIKQDEIPDMAGLLINSSFYIRKEGGLRPFLHKKEYLQNRISHRGLDEWIVNLEKRSLYGAKRS